MTAGATDRVVQSSNQSPLKVGVHGNNLHLRLARAIAGFDGDARFDFVDYADGRETAALIRAGVIDVGGTGSTPPLAAQAAGLDVVYLAASRPRPANGAVLVLEASRIASLSGLTGRRIALIEGSFHTYLLADLAEQAGLRLSDFDRIDLSPAESARALRGGRVEAWIAMDPHLPAELAKGGVAVLAGSAGVVPNRSLFWTDRSIASAREPRLAELLALLSRVAPFLVTQAEAAAAALSEAGDATPEQWLGVLRSRDWTLAAIDDLVLDEQRREADSLVRHGVLSARLEAWGAGGERARPDAISKHDRATP